MRAIILAAGVSRRLYPITWNIAKSLLEVGGKSIIDHQISALIENGITDITIVVGYFREKLMKHVSDTHPEANFDFVVNHHYFETNTAHSLEMCRRQMVAEPILLMNADVLYPKQLLTRVIKSEYPTVLAVEIKRCGREEVKVIEGEHRRIVAIGKELIQENSLGEFIGVAKFSTEFNQLFATSLKHLIDGGGKADYFEAAIQPLLSKTNVYYEDVSDMPCVEIDFIEDLDKARDLVKSKWFD